MKKAFTMLELVFVIMIVGILSYFVSSSFQRNPLREAADQVVSHIRYTQHLAMQDDTFASNDSAWYRKRWQVRFSTAGGVQSYAIMSDINSDGNPNASVGGIIEVAKDPLNPIQYLIGTPTTSFFNNTKPEFMNKKLDLTSTYGVTRITVAGGGTGSTANRILFDSMGRPYRGDTNALNGGVIASPSDRIAMTPITVTLIDSNLNTMVITIEPETGYTHIL
ncbi:pilus assembly FimT family protein [Sulfurospirillum arsenophilum]|uniref:pilus assembly FimT family protein n=1 Tax=Sulfurospirillum arsenophilum TaxID=56698 RepID=UPI0005A81CA9|nr:type II secretion system protein [Sulfurospirillum arsenophilum]